LSLQPQRHPYDSAAKEKRTITFPIEATEAKEPTPKALLASRGPSDPLEVLESSATEMSDSNETVDVVVVDVVVATIPQRHPYNSAAREKLTITFTIEAIKAKGPAPKALLESPGPSDLMTESNETVDVVVVDVVVAATSLIVVVAVVAVVVM